MKTLYLHIGTMKTGSTAMQDFLYNNTEYLAANSFVYPKCKYSYTSISKKRNGSFLGSPACYYVKLNEESDSQLLNMEMEMIDDCFEEYDNVVLSEETAWYQITAKREETWNTFISHFQSKGVAIKVIVYLRRQDKFIESYWKQLVKHNKYKYSIEHCIEKRGERVNMDYYDNLEKVADRVGKENIIVRRYQKQDLVDGDIILDFLTVLGLPVDEFREEILNKDKRNLSTANNATAIAREMNRIPDITVDQSRRFENHLRSISELENKRSHQYSIFSVEEAKSLVEDYQEGNNRIAAEYIGDGKPLFDDVYKNGEKWTKDNPYFTSDVIRFMGSVMNDMMDRIEEQEERIKALEKANKNKGRRYHLRKLVSPK